MACPGLSPVAARAHQARLSHTPPSCHNTRSSKRTSVRWDRHSDDVHSKENSPPDFHATSSPQPHRSRQPAPRVALQYSQETLLQLRHGDRRLRGPHRRPQLAAETFVAPEPLEPCGTETAPGIHSDRDPFGLHELVKAARQLDPNDNVFEKHTDKQFQWVLSLPAADVDDALDSVARSGAQDLTGDSDRRYFGCNLLAWTKPPGTGHRLPGDPDDKYILLATPMDLQADPSSPTNVEFTTHQFQLIREQTQQMATATSPVPQSPYRPSPLSAASTQWSTAAEASDEGDKTLAMDARREGTAPLSTIEDSFEALDRAEEDQFDLDQFKDQIDAITAAAARMHLDNLQADSARVSEKLKILSPNANARPSRPSTVPVKTSAPRQEDPVRQEYEPMGAQAADASRDSTQDTTSSSLECEQNVVGRKPPTGTLRRVARPASLAPPKPIQKAKKQLTTSTFALPGERVARELKEKKAARLSLQGSSQRAAEGSPQRARSVRGPKPPTLPNFELPGERLSRQKKERFEQKLKEELELARQRRQFKARPSPASAAPTVRSTFTSRQRQSPVKTEQASGNGPIGDTSPRAGASKRQSMTMTASMGRTVSISSTTTASSKGRGRHSSLGQASSRTASTSVGSAVSGEKRNSTEETPRRKGQGRQVHDRDHTAGRSKEQEKRDREEAIKVARQKYAQMSRHLAATNRAKRTQQPSSTLEDVSGSGKETAPQVPKHVELNVGRNF